MCLHLEILGKLLRLTKSCNCVQPYQTLPQSQNFKFNITMRSIMALCLPARSNSVVQWPNTTPQLAFDNPMSHTSAAMWWYSHVCPPYSCIKTGLCPQWCTYHIIIITDIICLTQYSLTDASIHCTSTKESTFLCIKSKLNVDLSLQVSGISLLCISLYLPDLSQNELWF